jgi:phytanoyl-CoA hydroxylase
VSATDPRFPHAARYLALAARGRNAWWCYGLGVLTVVFFFELLGFVPYWLMAQYTAFGTRQQFIALNLGVLTGLAGLAIAMAWIHRRHLLSLVTPYTRFDWRRALTGAAVWAALAVVCSVVEAVLFPGRYRLTFNPEVFFASAALALLLTPLQTATEELLFRGYVMQGLGRLFRRPWLLIVASAVIFTLPHAGNPEVAESPWLVLPQYFVMGALLAAVTLKDGRLELAIGIHAANNLFTGIVANIEPSVISTDAIFTSVFDPAYALVALIAASIATYVILFRRQGDEFSNAELTQFEHDGYVVVRSLADPVRCAIMLAKARRDLAAAAPPVEFEAETGYPGAPASLDAPGGRTVRRLLQAYARSIDFARWQTAPALAARLRQLLGQRVEMAQAHHNCVMTKNPGFSSVTHWHQDIRYWSYQRPELVSVWTALGREHAGNGCLAVLPGTHCIEFSPAQFDDDKFLRPEHPANAALLATRVNVELDTGDVLFFHCRLLHAAGDNRGSETKFSLVSTYHASSNHPLPGTRTASMTEIPL